MQIPHELDDAFSASLKYLTDTNTDVHRRCVAAIFYFYVTYPQETEDLFHQFPNQSNSRARSIIRFFRERYIRLIEDVFDSEIKGITPASTSYYTHFAYAAEYMKLIDEGEVTMRNIRRWHLEGRRDSPIFYPVARSAVNVRLLGVSDGIEKIVNFLNDGHKTNNGINPNAKRYELWVEFQRAALYAEEQAAKNRTGSKRGRRVALTSEEFANHAAVFADSPKIAQDHFRTIISRARAQSAVGRRRLRPYTFFVRDARGEEHEVWEELQDELFDLASSRGYYPGSDEKKPLIGDDDDGVDTSNRIGRKTD